MNIKQLWIDLKKNALKNIIPLAEGGFKNKTEAQINILRLCH